MRNFPLQFIDEKTVNHINQVNARRPVGRLRGSWAARIWQALLENLDGDGPRSIANLERIMKADTRTRNRYW